MADYAHPETLVTTQWVADHLNDPKIRPGAVNIPCSQAANEDGTFKSADALRQLYQSKGITGCTEVIAYCRIGERSSWAVVSSESR